MKMPATKRVAGIFLMYGGLKRYRKRKSAEDGYLR